VLLATALLWPAGASAHGLIQRANLPIPEWLFGWAAAIVLIVSFAALAVLWPNPRLEGANGWRPLPGGLGTFFAGRGVEIACGVIGVFLLVLTVVSGLFGAQEALANFAPTFVFITFWVGMVFASVLFGNVYRAFNPWRAIGRVLFRTAHKEYPERVGRWPAAVGLFAFTWLELASQGWSQDPNLLAVLILAYTAVQLWGMWVYGVEPWIDNAEAFSVYYGFFARISPVHQRDGVVGVRPPLSGLTTLERLPGTVAVVCVMIGTVTFDGLEQGKTWTNLANRLTDLFDGLGFGTEGTGRLVATIGLMLGVGLVSGFYALGIAGAKSVGGDQTANRLRRGFVHSLIPIALVYVVAHYLTFFIFEGQGIVALASDPLGKGWDLFGTASSAIDFGLISQNQTWYLQVGFVVAGHVAALILAHERALVLYNQAKLAVRSQYWMLAVMVGFTTLALWLLAQAGTAAAVKEASPAPKTATRSEKLVDFSKKPPYVNALELDPANGDFLLTTNRGFWRIEKDSKKVSRISGTVSAKANKDSVGTFLLVKSTGGQTLIGSGHPDHQDTLPQFIGFMRSEDLGKTWKVVSRLGGMDLHKIELKHDRMYAFDAVLSAIVISADEGKTFKEHFTPRGLIIDFVVDPEDPKYILADNDDELFASSDSGDQWKPLLRSPRMRLSWPAAGFLYRADQDGKVYTSDNRGRTWEEISSVDGEPYKFLETDDPEHLYLALSDGSILETTDGAKTWKDVFHP
jgi:photosystem II stability/assembly factor-like uncharacterized protein